MEWFFKRTNNYLKKNVSYQLQTNYWIHRKKIQNNNIEDGLSFFNKKDAACYKWREKGHISPNCTKSNKYEHGNNNSDKDNIRNWQQIRNSQQNQNKDENSIRNNNNNDNENISDG